MFKYDRYTLYLSNDTDTGLSANGYLISYLRYAAIEFLYKDVYFISIMV